MSHTESRFMRRFIDYQVDPPAIVDEDLPTTTVKLTIGKGGRFRAPHGTQTGSYRITGSHRELTAPGTYALRVTRVSVASGSRETNWYIRHSRKGTVDIIYFPAPGQETRLGGPMNPIYAFGPGTVIYGFLESGSAHWLSQHMEGIVSTEGITQ